MTFENHTNARAAHTDTNQSSAIREVESGASAAQCITMSIKHMLYCRFLKYVLLNFVCNVGQRCRYLNAYIL